MAFDFDLAGKLRREWPVIRQAPATHIFWGVASLIASFLLAWAWFSARLEGYKDELDIADRKIASHHGEIAKLNTKIAELEASQASPASGVIPRKDPPALLAFIKLDVRSGLPVIQAGKPFLINVGVMNDGPALARDAKFATAYKVARSPDSGAEEKMFLDELSSYLDRNLVHHGDMPKETGTFTTIGGQLRDDVVSQIRNDSIRLYVLGRATWNDVAGTHEAESCRYLKPPGTEAVWRFCESHNFTR